MRRSLSLASLSLLACLALSLPALAAEEMTVTPQGPGTVFGTVEAAAVDGLAYAHAEQMKSRNKRLSRGGAVVPVEGGFTYGSLDVASADAPDMVPLRLPESALAHFHTYPAQKSSVDRRNESHSKADRLVVDYGDSKHRPSFVLTPSLRVVAYRGRAATKRVGSKMSEMMLADLTESRDTQRIASAH